jgi:archaellum biogenesis ATPase FlaH
MEDSVFNIENKAKVTYINKITNEFWGNWKVYEECTEEEKQKINLASYPSNCILFDRDLKDYSEEQIEEDYKGFTTMLRKRGINCFYSYRSPNGYHILAPFDGLDKLDDDLRKEIRKYYISLFMTDPAKISDRGVVSLPNKPHFKNNIVYDIKDNFKGVNGINDIVLEECKKSIIKNRETIKKINDDVDFKNYFEEDKFFKFIKENKIPDGTNRDVVIFPNLAIAAVKTGKTKKEIDEIIKPIIKDNFPGKIYHEFEGWLKKAMDGRITDYNPIQLNNWSKIFLKDKNEFYDLNPIKILNIDEKTDIKEIVKNNGKFQFYWDWEFRNLETTETKWIVKNWIAKGDICFIAGKAASFKSTICLHIAYSIANGLLVFNKYETDKSKVLYLNEENPLVNFKNMVKRVRNGLDLKEEDKDNVAFSQMQGVKLDNNDDLKYLIDYIKTNNIEVLICDSLRRFIGFDENSATDMNRFFDNMKTLRRICKNLTIIILHHLKKENAQYNTDMRDMLRGSSDIVNSADCVIGIRRKHGFNAIQIEHIKNRSGLEMENKLILINNGDDDKSAYFYESDRQMDETKGVSKVDNCAEDIAKLVKDEKKLEFFGRNDLTEIQSKYSYDTITRAIRMMKISGEIIETNAGKYVKYKFI